MYSSLLTLLPFPNFPDFPFVLDFFVLPFLFAEAAVLAASSIICKAASRISSILESTSFISSFIILKSWSISESILGSLVLVSKIIAFLRRSFNLPNLEVISTSFLVYSFFEHIRHF